MWTFFQLLCLVPPIVLISSFSITLRHSIHEIWEKIKVSIRFGFLTAEVTAIRMPTINLKKADIAVEMLITNPNPLSIPFMGISYLIESHGRKLVSGSITKSGRVNGRTSKIVNMTTELIYDGIHSTYNDIKPESVIPYRIKLNVDIVDIPIFGRFALPLEKEGLIPVPVKPEAELTKIIEYDELSFEEIAVTLHLLLKNDNGFELRLKLLELELWVCEVHIASVTCTDSDKIVKNGNKKLQIPASFSPKDFGHAIWNAITEKSIDGNIIIDTEFGNMKLPIIKEGGITSMEKQDKHNYKELNVIHVPKIDGGRLVPPFEPPSPCWPRIDPTAFYDIGGLQVDDITNVGYGSPL